MDLMVRLQQINPLAAVAWQPHAFRPVPLESPVLVHGDEAVGGTDVVPERGAVVVVGRAVGGVPHEGLPCAV